VYDMEEPHKLLGLHRARFGTNRQLNQFVAATNPAVMHLFAECFAPSLAQYDWGSVKEPLRGRMAQALVAYCRATIVTFAQHNLKASMEAKLASLLVGFQFQYAIACSFSSVERTSLEH
jgi:hypothetical protein